MDYLFIIVDFDIVCIFSIFLFFLDFLHVLVGNIMFTLIYKFSFYRFFKSGLLLDFFFKKFISLIVFFIFSTFSIFFTEKYFIEFNFLQINRLLNLGLYWVDTFTNKFSYSYFHFLFYLYFLILVYFCITD